MMAKVSKAVRKEFQEVNSFPKLFRQFEMGSTEGPEKVCSREVIIRHGTCNDPETVAPKATTICSLTDEQRLLLLLKVRCCI